MKHAHHEFDVDQPGKDSFKHRQAGASEVLISSSARWALMHEHRGAAEPVLADLLRHMSPVDLVIVEGFKRDSFAKLEVHRPSLGKPLLYPDDPDIVALASDAKLPRLAAAAPAACRRGRDRRFHHRALRARGRAWRS